MMLNKNSKDATGKENSEKEVNKKKNKKSKAKTTSYDKALRRKQRVQRAANAKVRNAEAKIKKAEQAAANKGKAAEKKEKNKEKKLAEIVKKEEQKIEQEEKKKAEKAANKQKRQEERAKEKAEKAQRKAEMAARSPLQKKIDRRIKRKKFLTRVLILLILAVLVLAGIKFGPTLIEKANIPENFTKITENIKSKIPFLNKEKEPAADAGKGKETYICETKLINKGQEVIFSVFSVIGE